MNRNELTFANFIAKRVPFNLGQLQICILAELELSTLFDKQSHLRRALAACLIADEVEKLGRSELESVLDEGEAERMAEVSSDELRDVIRHIQNGEWRKACDITEKILEEEKRKRLEEWKAQLVPLVFDTDEYRQSYAPHPYKKRERYWISPEVTDDGLHEVYEVYIETLDKKGRPSGVTSISVEETMKDAMSRVEREREKDVEEYIKNYF